MERVELCAGVGCRRREQAGHGRRTAAAGRLCPVCRQRLGAELRELPRLYEACGRILGGGRAEERQTRVAARAVAAGLPFNTAACEVRSAVLSTLGCWSALVAEERGLSRPERTARTMATHLERHLSWLCGHPAAGELSEEVSRLARWAYRVADPDPQRRVPVGGCAEADCAGSLAAYVRPDSPGSMAEIRCDADPEHRWAGEEWTRLGRRMLQHRSDTATAGKGPEAWLTAADISRLWQIPRGSVYRLASERSWRRVSRGGRTCYVAADVSETLRKRLPA